MPLRERDQDLLAPVKNRNPEEEQNIGMLAAFAALLFALVCGAGICFYVSYVLLRFEFSASREPLDVELLKLEKGEALPGSHVAVDPHIAMYDGRIGDFYPIVSIEDTLLHPGVTPDIGVSIGYDMANLSYRTRSIRMLVLESEPGSGVVFGGPLQGMVVGTADQSNQLAKQLEKMGVKDPGQVYLLVPGRTPNIWPGVIILIVGLALATGIYFAIWPMLRLLKKFGYD